MDREFDMAVGNPGIAFKLRTLRTRGYNFALQIPESEGQT